MQNNYILCPKCECNPCECETMQNNYKKKIKEMKGKYKGDGLVARREDMWEMCLDEITPLIEEIVREELEKYEKAIKYAWRQATPDSWGIPCHYSKTFYGVFRKKLKTLTK